MTYMNYTYILGRIRAESYPEWRLGVYVETLLRIYPPVC